MRDRCRQFGREKEMLSLALGLALTCQNEEIEWLTHLGDGLRRAKMEGKPVLLAIADWG